MTAYTEVIQDAMLELLAARKLRMASATAFSLSPDAAAIAERRHRAYRYQILLRPQEISNHPELIRRLRCIAMNALIEPTSTATSIPRISWSRIQNGIGAPAISPATPMSLCS